MVQIAQSSADRSGKPVFRFESDATASFLVVECSARVLEYQALMLGFNRIRHVLPVDVVIKEGMNCYYYNITSKISLSFFLGRRKLDREEFLKLLLDIASVVNESAGYLLTGSNFIFDSEYIYVSPERIEPLLVYVPAMLEGGSGTSLQTFISDLLMLHINADGFRDGNLVQRILSEVKSESFNIKSLILVINDFLYANRPNKDFMAEERETAGELKPLPERIALQEKKPLLERKLLQEKKPLHERNLPRNGSAHQEKHSHQSESPHQDGHPFRIKEEVLEITSSFRVPGLAVIVIIAQIIMGMAIFAGHDFLNNISDNPTATYAAVAMIVLAIDILLLKRLNAARLVRVEAVQKGSTAVETGNNHDLGVNNEPDQIMHSARTAANRAREIVHEDNRDSMRKTIIETSRDTVREAIRSAACKEIGDTAKEAAAAAFPEIMLKPSAVSGPIASASGKTELLADRIKGVRMLKSIRRQSLDEDIIINKDDFIIGRLAEHVDHVIQNNAIGKLHAQILNRNGTCFIKDLNSVNGTFINSKRIESNKEVELKENDKVLLANNEFIYFGG